MLLDTCCGTLIGIAVALVTVILTYFKWTYTYWQRRNVPFLEPKMPWGNAASPKERTCSSGLYLKRQYDEMKAKGWKHGGLYTILTPQYIPLNLDLVKNILTKDFQNFTDRGMYYNEKSDPLSAHLFNLGGHRWRNTRVKLSPTFTSGKMKMMFPIMIDCVPNFLQRIESDRVNQKPIDIKETLGCFTTDIIGSCAFGLDCNSTTEENSPFRVYTKKLFTGEGRSRLGAITSMAFPKIAKLFGVSITPKVLTEFFMKVITDTVEYREKNEVRRKDFIQMLIDMKNNNMVDENGMKQEGFSLTIMELAAESFVFFVAGFETSSTTMTFACFELASHQDLQEKLREEVNTVLEKHGGKITYEAIQEMRYMDQVINETLRKYPPVPMITRQCVKDYKVPDEDVIIEKDTIVVIPVLGIQHDKEYYPDPKKFDPERFNDENKNKRHPYAHIPFGEGPRICIGMRFGLTQTKVGLAALLKNYRLTVNEKTILPMKIAKKAFIPSAEGEIWLSAEKL